MGSSTSPWIDATRPVSAELPVWPGDTPYSYELAWSMAAGQSVNVGAIRGTVHLGTHVDAPFHFVADGSSVEQLPLEAFIGPAVVVDVTGQELITPALLDGLDLSQTPRVLFRTGVWPVGAPFPERVPRLAPELPQWLAERGVVLVGLDSPSVDAIDSTSLEAHLALSAAGIQILESLMLDLVAPGRYSLLAVPLALVGADASPVRALLQVQP